MIHKEHKFILAETIGSNICNSVIYYIFYNTFKSQIWSEFLM